MKTVGIVTVLVKTMEAENMTVASPGASMSAAADGVVDTDGPCVEIGPSAVRVAVGTKDGVDVGVLVAERTASAVRVRGADADADALDVPVAVGGAVCVPVPPTEPDTDAAPVSDTDGTVDTVSVVDVDALAEPDGTAAALPAGEGDFAFDGCVPVTALVCDAEKDAEPDAVALSEPEPTTVPDTVPVADCESVSEAVDESDATDAESETDAVIDAVKDVDGVPVVLLRSVAEVEPLGVLRDDELSVTERDGDGEPLFDGATEPLKDADGVSVADVETEPDARKDAVIVSVIDTVGDRRGLADAETVTLCDCVHLGDAEFDGDIVPHGDADADREVETVPVAHGDAVELEERDAALTVALTELDVDGEVVCVEDGERDMLSDDVALTVLVPHMEMEPDCVTSGDAERLGVIDVHADTVLDGDALTDTTEAVGESVDVDETVDVTVELALRDGDTVDDAHTVDDAVVETVTDVVGDVVIEKDTVGVRVGSRTDTVLEIDGLGEADGDGLPE